MKKSKHQLKNQQKQKDSTQEQTGEKVEKKPFWKYFSFWLKKPSSTKEGELWM